MTPFNKYTRQFTPEEIEAGTYRGMFGGMWEEIGRLQFEFLRARSLQPAHHLLDLGCGAMRGGIHALGYLEKGHYCGLDINQSLIDAARREVAQAGLEAQEPQLEVNGLFELGVFQRQFDYLLALSVFTHLFANHIVRCLVEVRRVLAPNGQFFATFFFAPEPAHLAAIMHEPGGIRTHYDRDPFHYSVAEIRAMSELAGISMEVIGEWNHPRAQQMVRFFR